MADAFRGLTIKIGADARPLNSAISSITRSASQAQSVFNRLGKALKMDPTDAKLMASRIELVNDKALHAARAANTIATSMRQAGRETLTFANNASLSGKSVREISRSVKSVHAETQRLLSSYNHVDAELQVINDAVRRLIASQNHISFDEARASLTKLQLAAAGTGREADAARRKIEHLIRSAVRQGGLGGEFGLGSTQADAWEMVYTYRELRRQQKDFNSDLEAMKKVEGYKTAEANMLAFRAEMRGAAAEAARLSSELYSTGASVGMQRAVAHARELDGAVDASIASAKRMSSAFKAMPTNIDAAKARLRAFRAEEQAVTAKTEALRAVMKSIEAARGFDKFTAQFGDVYTAAAKAESKVADINATMKTAEVRVEELEGKLKEARAASGGQFTKGINELNAELKEARVRLENVRAAMERAEAEQRTASLSKAWREARNEIVRYEAELERMNASKSLSSVLGSIGSSIRTMGYGIYSTLTPAIMIAGRYAIQAADDIDSSYRNMRKTVNGTEEEFEHLRQAALDFSTTHVTTADTILEIEALGGQLGIAASNLEGFATTVSNLDIATDIEASDLATYVGQLSNIMDDISAYKNDPEQYQQKITSLSDALVRLGNNSAAQESSIMKVMMRIASMGNISDMTTPQLLAISTAIAATGQGCEAAGTAISKTFSDIESAVSKGEDTLQAWADVAGMSAEEFARSWKETPTQAFTAFIEGLKRIDEEGGSVDGTLKGLDISSVRQKQALMGLTNTLDVLHASLGMSQDAWDGLSTVMADGSVEKAGDAAREAQRKSEGFSGELQMMKNNATMLASSLADGVAPIVGALGDSFSWLSGVVKDTPDSIKTLTVGALGLAAALGPLSVGIGSVIDGYTSVMAAGKSVKQITIMNKAQRQEYQDLARAIDLVRSNQAAYIAETGASCPKIAAQEKALLGQQKALMATGAAAQFATKAIGGIAAVGVGMLFTWGVSEAISYAGKLREQEELERNGYQGLLETVREFKGSADIAKMAIEGTGDASESAVKSFDEYREAADEARQAQSDFKDAVSERHGKAWNDVGQAYVLTEEMKKYAGTCEGSAEKLALLKTAVETFNQLTGSSIQVVDDFTGRLNYEGEQLDLLSQSYQNLAMADAYKSIASDAAKKMGSDKVQIEMYRKELEKLEAIEGNLQEQAMKDGFLSQDDRAYLDDVHNRANAARQLISDLEHDYNITLDTYQTAAKLYGDTKNAGEDASKSLDAARSSAEGFKQALSEAGVESSLFDDIYAMAQNSGLFAGTADEFAKALSDAGVSVSLFATDGAASFEDFYRQAEGDLSLVCQAIETVNNTGIDPKKLYFDDGGVKVKLDELDDAAREALKERGFKVNDDGSIEAIDEKAKALEDDLNRLAENPVTPKVGLDTSEFDSGIERTKRELAGLGIIKTTPSLPWAVEHGYGQAAGGVNMRPLRAIRAFAAGAAINGIVTGPMVTNQGLIGEAGTEAVLNQGRRSMVVPLSNRRYVAPFARAVASEMRGVGSTAIDSSTTYQIYLDGSLLAGDVNESMSIGQFVREIRIKAGAN